MSTDKKVVALSIAIDVVWILVGLVLGVILIYYYNIEPRVILENNIYFYLTVITISGYVLFGFLGSTFFSLCIFEGWFDFVAFVLMSVMWGLIKGFVFWSILVVVRDVLFVIYGFLFGGWLSSPMELLMTNVIMVLVWLLFLSNKTKKKSKVPS